MQKTLFAVVFIPLLAAGLGLLCWHNACFAGLPVSINGQPLPSLAPMLDAVTPAVVNISTSTHIEAQESPLFSDPIFRYFFDLPKQKKNKENNSLGSGVIIDARKGYVVTNHHVIDKADTITVTLRNGENFTAQLIGADAETDVALLQIPIKAHQLTALKISDSESLRVGDFVVAIGNPFGLGQTVTSGIVSALGRTGLGIEGYEDFIQTDASINPGNSGGALVNLRGELIGINTAILAPSGGNVGIGFAIPSSMVKKIIAHLAEYGEIQRGTLGVSVQDLSPDLVHAFDLEQQQGAVVIEVAEDSAAAQAGLKVGDVITAINGKAVRNAADMRNQVGLVRAGEKVDLGLQRNRHTVHINVQLAEQGVASGDSVSDSLQGASLKEIKLKTDAGRNAQRVQITAVETNSQAWDLGLRQGDLILSVNRRIRVQSIHDLAQLLNQGGQYLSIQILRDDTTYSVRLR
jgi:Do/DeqQ family serine protease